jgi:hypothetical protein
MWLWSCSAHLGACCCCCCCAMNVHVCVVMTSVSLQQWLEWCAPRHTGLCNVCFWMGAGFDTSHTCLALPPWNHFIRQRQHDIYGNARADTCTASNQHAGTQACGCLRIVEEKHTRSVQTAMIMLSLLGKKRVLVIDILHVQSGCSSTGASGPQCMTAHTLAATLHALSRESVSGRCRARPCSADSFCKLHRALIQAFTSSHCRNPVCCECLLCCRPSGLPNCWHCCLQCN